MHDSIFYDSEIKNELRYDDCLKILKDFKKTCSKLGAKPLVAFAGGDPLLRKDFFDLLEECKKMKIKVNIIGNPFLITNEIALKLKKAKINGYQISIDGLEKTHDFFREKESFKKSLEALEILNKNKINNSVMFTLSKKNKNDLIPLIKFIAGKTDLFDFARFVPTGSGTKIKKEILSAKEYHTLLEKVFLEYEKLKGKTKTNFGKKDHLWKLLEFEKGILKPENTGLIEDGCSLGIRHLTILADGKVLACRRMPIEIGKVPEQSLFDIFLKSKKLNELREINKMKKCGKCELLNYCRGCPAVAFAIKGNYFDKDPQCWKKFD